MNIYQRGILVAATLALVPMYYDSPRELVLDKNTYDVTSTTFASLGRIDARAAGIRLLYWAAFTAALTFACQSNSSYGQDTERRPGSA